MTSDRKPALKEPPRPSSSPDGARKLEPGYRPARAEAHALLAKLGEGDDRDALVVERALARLGLEITDPAMERFLVAASPERGRLCRLVGRVAQTTRSTKLRRFLLDRLDDADLKTRRNAIIALGKFGDAEVETAFLDYWGRAPIEHRRSLAQALGKLGSERALALLTSSTSEDVELTRISAEAVLKLERTLGRARGEAGQIDASRAPLSPTPLVVHCRIGLEQLLIDELGQRAKATKAADGQVRVELSEPLEALYRARTMLRYGFPLPKGGRTLEEVLVLALTSESAWQILSRFTEGPIRYRIEWAGGGHRRGLTYRCARQIAEKRPQLINDPTATLWEVVVDESTLAVELWPRGLADPRFVYRRAQVPASSHPTIAAALAKVGGVRADDVVWDPFVGAGAELVERARLGAAKRFVGTDIDAHALDAARENLAAAGVPADLTRADACVHRPPEAPTLVITNPPMGRRVLDRTRTGPLYDAFLAHVAAVLAPGGRLVWISPRANATLARAAAVGLRVGYRQRVDMSGFWGEIQSFTLERSYSRSSRGAKSAPARR